MQNRVKLRILCIPTPHIYSRCRLSLIPRRFFRSRLFSTEERVRLLHANSPYMHMYICSRMLHMQLSYCQPCSPLLQGLQSLEPSAISAFYAKLCCTASRRVSHGDVRLSNMLVDKDRLVFCDFGQSVIDASPDKCQQDLIMLAEVND